jgi:aryl-alcohol dehydrogenase-like predicted oxidoreductase
MHTKPEEANENILGASSMYAHEFAILQFTATLNHWAPFISMQNFYNLIYREEREMIPFCQKTGVGLVPWSPIARGILARPYEDKSSTRSTTDGMLKNVFQKHEGSASGLVDKEITDRVQKVAKDRETTMATVALAWVLSKGCMPLVGLSSPKRIDEAVKALKFMLTDEETKFLEEPYVSKGLRATKWSCIFPGVDNSYITCLKTDWRSNRKSHLRRW